MNPVMQSIITFTRETTFTHLPSAVVEKAKQGVIDFLGCTLLGCKNEVGKTIGAYVKSINAAPEVTVIGSGFKTSRALASLAIGTFSHADDFDDISFSLPGHPSVTVLPAAVSIGEAENISGREFITAYVVGFEIQCKLGQALAPKLYQNGWHATSVLGTLGAAATAGRLLSLSEEQLCHCLGIAASMASGLRANLGTMTKPLHVAFATHNGVTAAILARQGITASLEALDGSLGFCQTLADGVVHDKIVGMLGNPYDIITPGIIYKRYPSCAETHPALDATISLAQEHHLNPDDVRSVDCIVTPLNHDVLVYSSPRTALEGKFSLHFCVALGLSQRRAALEDFSDDMVSDPEIVRLMEKVTMTPDPSLAEDGYTGAATIVNVRMNDGSTYTSRVDHAKGSPKNPMSMEELLVKYRECAGKTLRPGVIETTIDQLLRLEQVENISDLIALLDTGLSPK
jgi:2-methylcitrate dehydratase PrpD